MTAERLVAHRGFQHCYPENTLAAIHGAIDAGALNIELDVLFSADGEPVIYHDATLERVSGVAGSVHQFTLTELAKIPASEAGRLGQQFASESIAPLAALIPVMQQHPHIRFFVEAKRSGLKQVGQEFALNKLLGLLTPVQAQVVCISFDKPFVAAARQQDWPLVGMVLESWDDLGHLLIADTSPEYLFCSQRHIPDGQLPTLPHSKWVIYEIGDSKGAIDWFQRGADMVETFNIGGLLKELDNNSL
ncbi:hypothetical protein KFE80_01650 [bacterium SCSIO 12696]|nr:hypothetical protein KFE80_01650 [bacterium SCSIO 12696]